MPNLTIKNFPDELYEKVKARAKAEHRSFNAQALLLLEQYLAKELISVKARLAEQELQKEKRRTKTRTRKTKR